MSITSIAIGSGALMFGSDQAETFTSTTGNDYLRGNGGADTFVFATGGGHDMILDFHPGEDHLQMHNVSPRTVSFHDTNAGVVVDYGHMGATGQDAVLLAGVHADQLHPTDFIFA